MLLDQGILAMEGDRVEVQVEGLPTRQPEPARGVEPAVHQLGIAGGSDPATVLGQERAFGDDIQPGEEGQPLIQHRAHDMTVACRPEQLQGQERSEGTTGRDHLRGGEPRPGEDAVQGDRGQHGQEQEQAAELGPEGAWAEVELPDIRDVGRRRVRAGWAFLVGPARQPCEPFLLEDVSDGDRTEGVSLVGQGAANVIDREVLLAEGDDAVAEGIGLGCGVRSLGGGEEEVAVRILPELMDQDAKAAGGVTESAGDFGAGEAIDEEGAEGLVSAVGGVGRLEEDSGEVY